jgi:hypothetical protein
MAVYGSPEYHPTWYQKAYSAVAKRAPFYIGRFLQIILYWIFQAARFVGQMFKDAIGG